MAAVRGLGFATGDALPVTGAPAKLPLVEAETAGGSLFGLLGTPVKSRQCIEDLLKVTILHTEYNNPISAQVNLKSCSKRAVYPSKSKSTPVNRTRSIPAKILSTPRI